MGVKSRVGIEGLRIHSIHYTPGEERECINLHGHTFIVNVEVEGEVKAKGMVLDFATLKKIIVEVASEYDHAVIIPENHRNQIKLQGPFKVKVKTITYPYATTEYIALSLAREICLKTGMKTRVRLYEGPGKYAETEWCNPNE